MMFKSEISNLKEVGMESIVRKSFLSLIIMMLIAFAMPAIVNAAENPVFTMEDMKLNKIIYFDGQTYSPINYSCKDKYKKEYHDERTAGIVWKLNRKYDSIVIQLSNGRFRTIKVDDVLEIREGDFIKVNTSSLEETMKGNLKLNITIDGEENKVEFSNKALVNIDTNGALSLSAKEGDSKVTITKKGEESEPIEFYIIKNAEGNVILDIDDQFITADAKAEVVQALTTGADAKLAVEDGVLVLAANAKVDNLDQSETYVEAGAELSYDTTKIEDEENDVMANVHANVLGHKVEKTEINTRIVRAVRSILNRISSLLSR